jgi:DNA polymerase-3 subunit gamma/tau
MLTTEASNALLKTLEEPPSHVIFILATTNPEKLIETIRSRTTNIVFTNANMEEVKRSLARVIKGERLKVDDEIVEMVVKAAKGSFRDSHKILEQLVNEGIISDKNKVEEYLFKGQASNVEELLHAVSEKNVKEALKLIEKAVSQGVALDDFSESFLARLHANLLAKEGIGKDELGKLSKSELIGLIKLIGEAYDKMRFSFIEQLPLEIAIVEWAGGGRKVRDSDEKERVLEQNGQTGKDGENGRSTMGGLLKAHQTSVANGNGNGGINDKMWKEILQAVKPKNTSIEALLRAAKPLEYDGNTLKLGVFYKFHKERLEEGHHRKILEEVAAGVLGGETRIICTLTKPPAIKNPEKQLARDKDVVLTESDDEDIINVAKEIFGN